MRPNPTNISLRNVVFGLLSLVIITGCMMVVIEIVDISQLQNIILQSGPWAPILYIVFKALAYIIAPLSGGLLKVASGTLFGLWSGTIYTLLGDIIGGCTNFFLARIFGRRIVTRFVGKKGMARVEGLTYQLGEWRALLFARVFLSTLYDFVSYAAGLTSVSFRKYFIITLLGGIVPTFLIVAVGAGLAFDRRMLLLAYIGLGILFITPIALQRLRRHAISQNDGEEHQ